MSYRYLRYEIDRGNNQKGRLVVMETEHPDEGVEITIRGQHEDAGDGYTLLPEEVRVLRDTLTDFLRHWNGGEEETD